MSAEWKRIGERRIYFRSNWEYRYALYLDFLKQQGIIKEWEHEPQTFWFHKIKRGCVTYLPDFKVYLPDGNGVRHHEWHEVKGFMDSKSKTKLKRFAKYYPEEKLVLIDKEWFKKHPTSNALLGIQ